MIPKLMDTKRQQRVLGIDSTPSFVQIDPQQQEPVQKLEEGISINPSIGMYDVRVVVGTNYTTQRSQAQQALAEVMRTSPNLTPAIAPLWSMNLDIPNADKLSQVLTAMAPPEIQAIMNPDQDGQPKPEELIAKNKQLEQQLEQAGQLLQQAGEDLQVKEQALKDKQLEIDVQQYNAETNRLKVTGANEEQIEAIVQNMVGDMLNSAQEPMQEPAMLDEFGEEIPPEPPQPSPDVLAILDVMNQQTQIQAQAQSAQAQSQIEMANAISGLAQSIAMPVKKTPVRDKAGNISHVIEQRIE